MPFKAMGVIASPCRKCSMCVVEIVTDRDVRVVERSSFVWTGPANFLLSRPYRPYMFAINYTLNCYVRVMANFITNASVEELTETYGDVSDLGVPAFASNNGYDNFDTNNYLNCSHACITAMVNGFNVGLHWLGKMKPVFKCVCAFIAYLAVYIDFLKRIVNRYQQTKALVAIFVVYISIVSVCIGVNENCVFLAVYVVDIRRLLNAESEIFEVLDVVAVYFAYAGIYYDIDPIAYSILYFVAMKTMYAI